MYVRIVTKEINDRLESLACGAGEFDVGVVEEYVVEHHGAVEGQAWQGDVEGAGCDEEVFVGPEKGEGVGCEEIVGFGHLEGVAIVGEGEKAVGAIGSSLSGADKATFREEPYLRLGQGPAVVVGDGAAELDAIEMARESEELQLAVARGEKVATVVEGVESNLIVVGGAVERRGQGLDYVFGKYDIVDLGARTDADGIEVESAAAVGPAVGGVDEVVAIENGADLVALGVDGVAQVDRFGPPFAVPEGAPEVETAQAYFALGGEDEGGAVGGEDGMGDLAEPGLDLYPAVFKEAGIGVDVEAVGLVVRRGDEIEKAVATVAHHVVGIGTETGEGGVGGEGGEGGAVHVGRNEYAVLQGIECAIDHGEVGEPPGQSHVADRGDRYRSLRPKGMEGQEQQQGEYG